jgi:hypothetical protein
MIGPGGLFLGQIRLFQSQNRYRVFRPKHEQVTAALGTSIGIHEIDQSDKSFSRNLALADRPAEVIFLAAFF